jgi:hypothetical protein
MNDLVDVIYSSPNWCLLSMWAQMVVLIFTFPHEVSCQSYYWTLVGSVVVRINLDSSGQHKLHSLINHGVVQMQQREILGLLFHIHLLPEPFWTWMTEGQQLHVNYDKVIAFCYHSNFWLFQFHLVAITVQFDEAQSIYNISHICILWVTEYACNYEL